MPSPAIIVILALGLALVSIAMPDAAMIAALVAFIGLAVVLGWRRTASARQLLRDPDLKASRALPYRERVRLSRLARSEQPIADPGDAAGAELIARTSLKGVSVLDSSYSFKQLIPGAILGVLGVFVGRYDVLLIMAAVASVVGLGIYWTRRSRAKLLRTADINGWDLSI